MGYSLKSYSVVADGIAKKECAVLVFSIRQFSSLPVYIFCDDEAHIYLKNKPELDPILFRVCLNKEALREQIKKTCSVRKHNKFHRPEIIACKMDCIRWATEESGNTLFVDADLIFVDDPAKDICGKIDLMLSAHFPVKNAVTENRKYGVFNAGYLYAGCPEVADVWTEIYLKRSTFYEQQGMIHFFEHFNTKLFDEAHNIGFWRYERYWKKGKLYLGKSNVDYENAVSYHMHYFKENYARADAGLRNGYDKLGNLIKSVLPQNIKRFANAL